MAGLGGGSSDALDGVLTGSPNYRNHPQHLHFPLKIRNLLPQNRFFLVNSPANVTIRGRDGQMPPEDRDLGPDEQVKLIERAKDPIQLGVLPNSVHPVEHQLEVLVFQKVLQRDAEAEDVSHEADFFPLAAEVPMISPAEVFCSLHERVTHALHVLVERGIRPARVFLLLLIVCFVLIVIIFILIFIFCTCVLSTWETFS